MYFDHNCTMICGYRIFTSAGKEVTLFKFLPNSVQDIAS